MTENDYIAEYIKEEHPTLLGVDFAWWKTKRMAFNVGRKIVEVFNKVDWSNFPLSDDKSEEEDADSD